MTSENDCKESFKVKITERTGDYFVTYKNGKYEKASGRTDIVVSVSNPENVYDDIISLLSILRKIGNITTRLQRFDEIVEGLDLKNHIDATLTIQNRINKLQHKLESLKYHIQRCSKQEKEYEDGFKDKYVNSIVGIEEIDPIFVFETESFLFQIKSALDIIAQIIGIAYRITQVHTYAEDGRDLIDKLKKSSAHRDYQEQKEEMINIIKSNENWIKQLVFMRDLITHFSDLIGFKSITHKAAFDENEYATICYPSMPNGERITTFMGCNWTNLTKLIESVSTNIASLYSKIS